MKVPESPPQGTRVRLPGDVVRPFDVFVNGIQQHEGSDYRIDGRTLVFARELRTEGKLGFWRWLSLWVGIAGTYRQNDSVDVAYKRGGQPVVATRLPLEPLGGSPSSHHALSTRGDRGREADAFRDLARPGFALANPGLARWG